MRAKCGFRGPAVGLRAWLGLVLSPAGVGGGWLDTPLHLDQATNEGRFSTMAFLEAAEAGLGERDRPGMAWAVLLPTPQTPGRRFCSDCEEPLPVVRSPPNPRELAPHLEAFERWLAHNRQAKIVCVHFGGDRLKTRTVARSRTLILRHPHFSFSLAAVFPMPAANRPPDRGRRLRPDGRVPIAEFPNRFLLGSDEFLRVPREGRRRAGELLAPTLSIAEQLPEEPARRVGYENAQRLYRRPPF